jgi:hypothetical protein
MIERVECRRCKAQRDMGLVPENQRHLVHCFICHAQDFVNVEPTAGDRAAIKQATAAVVAAAEQVDLELHRNKGLLRIQPCAQRLAEACRQLAFARAGVVP